VASPRAQSQRFPLSDPGPGSRRRGWSGRGGVESGDLGERTSWVGTAAGTAGVGHRRATHGSV